MAKDGAHIPGYKRVKICFQFLKPYAPQMFSNGVKRFVYAII